jgi:uncharacterized protein
MTLTAIYASLVAPLFIFLAVRVIQMRRSAKISFGDGDDKAMLRRMRVHANFAEYAPFTLILLALAESVGTMPLLLHVCGIGFVLGRYIHAYGLSQSPETMIFRQLGMAFTFTVIGVLAAICLYGAIIA